MMTARLLVCSLTACLFAIALALLLPGAGCSPTEPAVEVVNTQPNESSAPLVEPDDNEPVIAPNTVKPKLWPEIPEANVAESNQPQQPEPNRPEPNETAPAPRVTFNDKCRGILTDFVNDQGMVEYRRLKIKRADLNALLDQFAKLDHDEYARWPEEDKIALWINAYNIQMLNVIIQNYPIKSSAFLRFLWPPTSIRHIDPADAIGVEKWDRYKFMVKGEVFTLSEIEGRFFRKEFGEPRVFLALTQACLSGPPLRNEPYTGHKLYEQLDNQVRKFLSSPRALRIDRENQKVFLSSLFDPTWYGKDFIKKYDTDKKFKAQKPAIRAALNFVAGYLSPEDREFLETGYYTVGYIPFDWRLNDSSEDD